MYIGSHASTSNTSHPLRSYQSGCFTHCGRGGKTPVSKIMQLIMLHIEGIIDALNFPKFATQLFKADSACVRAQAVLSLIYPGGQQAFCLWQVFMRGP